MRKTLLATALTILSFSSLANEWNFNDDDFNNTGAVVLKTTSGQSVSVDNSGSAQAFSVSNAPSVINNSSSSSSSSGSIYNVKIYNVNGPSSWTRGVQLSLNLPKSCSIVSWSAKMTREMKTYHTTGCSNASLSYYSEHGGIHISTSDGKRLVPIGGSGSLPASSQVMWPEGTNIKLTAGNTCSYDACNASNQRISCSSAITVKCLVAPD